MIKKRTEKVEVAPSIDPQKGIDLLRKQKGKLDELIAKKPFDRAGQKAWENTTNDYLIKIFGSKSDNIRAVIHASSDYPLIVNMSDQEREQYILSKMTNQSKMIDSCIEQLETTVELLPKKESINNMNKIELGNKVFIVHGHNHGIKDSVARLIGTFNLEPIILHEKANEGKTLIEKFIKHSDVHFAIIILSADDVGADKDKSKSLSMRARQNVIMELGYFMGKLGRNRVCALYEDGVELPSDYIGVGYISLDAKDKWKFDIVKELKAAGFKADANEII